METHFVDQLVSDHEEADTKLVAMAFSTQLLSESLMVRSPSGDIDILVLFLLHNTSRIFIDNGTGKARKILDMSTSGLGDTEKKALAGLHAFSGNDYVSSFYKQGKKKMWSKVKKNDSYLELFENYGSSDRLSVQDNNRLEKFVCDLYGFPKDDSVDVVRKKLYIRKSSKVGKSIELASLPPCKRNLEYHNKRANFVAITFRRACNVVMNLPDPIYHGWNENGNAEWTENHHPDDLAELLFDEEFDTDSEQEEEEYSDSSDYEETDDEL